MDEAEINRIRVFIQNDNLREAINILNNVGLQNRLTQWENRAIGGTITEEAKRVERLQIAEAILSAVRIGHSATYNIDKNLLGKIIHVFRKQRNFWFVAGLLVISLGVICIVLFRNTKSIDIPEILTGFLFLALSSIPFGFGLRKKEKIDKATLFMTLSPPIDFVVQEAYIVFTKNSLTS